jgi:UDP-N-acetylmuramate dehydrogenase
MNLPKIRGSYRFNVELGKTSWFGVGGKADVIFRPEDSDDLIFFLQNKDKSIPISILGATSNVIIGDKGIRGVLIKLGKNFSNISHSKNQIIVGASNLCTNVAHYCQENSLGNLEFMSGIPGMAGGAIAMNAGCFENEVSDFFIKGRALDFSGNLIEFNKNQCQFQYRKNNFTKNLIIVETTFEIEESSSEKISNLIKKYQEYRNKTQPIRKKTGGSTFKNPIGQKSWKLIDEAGCRGLKIGDAQISEKHCNFMVNNNKAKASDLIKLGEEVRNKVKEKFDIYLDWEIKQFGEF